MSSNTNAACCSIPPVQADYKSKGSYKDLAGIKTYVTGDPSSNRVITVIYDIFGFWPTTEQGADILASQGFLVVMPDFFKGKPMPQEKFPPQSDEDKQFVQDFFSGPANPPDNLKVLSQVAQAASKEYTNVKYHGILGFCWGGKISVLASDKRDVFQATAIVHPAMMDAKDAKAITNPIMVLASKDEPADDVKAFEESLPSDVKSKSVVKTYDTMHHGWAAARADLKDPENLKKYTEAYEELANFFNTHISK